MALYASTEAGIAWFVDQFLKYAFVEPDPRVVWAVPLGALLLFLLRGIGDYLATYFPGSRGSTGGEGHPPRPVRPVPAPARRLRMTANPPRRMLSRLVYDAEQVAEAATNSRVRDHPGFAGADRTADAACSGSPGSSRCWRWWPRP